MASVGIRLRLKANMTHMSDLLDLLEHDPGQTAM